MQTEEKMKPRREREALRADKVWKSQHLLQMLQSTKGLTKEIYGDQNEKIKTCPLFIEGLKNDCNNSRT